MVRPIRLLKCLGDEIVISIVDLCQFRNTIHLLTECSNVLLTFTVECIKDDEVWKSIKGNARCLETRTKFCNKDNCHK